jgi:hypothetical protein
MADLLPHGAPGLLHLGPRDAVGIGHRLTPIKSWPCTAKDSIMQLKNDSNFLPLVGAKLSKSKKSQ